MTGCSRMYQQQRLLRVIINGIVSEFPDSHREQSSDGGAQIPLYLVFKNLFPYVNKYIGDVHTLSW
jgi:hypothetical protein